MDAKEGKKMVPRGEPRPEETKLDPKARLVIFDKDGTLIDFVAMWVSWTEDLGARLLERGALAEDAKPAFFAALGFDCATRKVSSTSPLCCSPMSLIKGICINWLAEHRAMDAAQAAQEIQAVWAMPCPEKTAKPLTDLPRLFSYLKDDLGMKIAVCTTDDGEVTIRTLQHLGVHHKVDAVLAGDHTHVDPKPSPNQIFHLCDTLGVCTRNVIMVGDTKTDMLMGRTAGVGLTIGVMDGASHLDDLRLYADCLVPDMDRFATLAALFCQRA